MEMTHDEANAILNEFGGWKPGERGDIYEIPPIDYFADTPEAREALWGVIYKLNARELSICIHPRWVIVHDEHSANVGEADATKPHAIAFALAAALKERGK